MHYISPSRLKRFRACPYQCKHEKFTASEATNFGNAVHAGLAAYYNGGEFLPAYRAEALKRKVPLDKEETAIACFEYSKSLEIDLETVVTVESADGEVSWSFGKGAQVSLTDKIGLQGSMDLVHVMNDGTLVIRDHKTGMTQEEDDLQLAVYALMAWKKYGEFPTIKTVFDYVQQGFSQSQFWNKETLVGALAYILPLCTEYLEAVQKNNWPQTPHSWCTYCSLKDTCQAYQKQLEAKPDRASYDIDATLENLPKILAYHDKIEGIAKAAYSIKELMSDKIKAVLEEHGAIIVEGRKFELRDRVGTYDYDLPAIFEQIGNIVGRAPLEICKYYAGGTTELRKNLDAADKKKLDAIVKNNRTVKSSTKQLKVSIAKQAMTEE